MAFTFLPVAVRTVEIAGAGDIKTQPDGFLGPKVEKYSWESGKCANISDQVHGVVFTSSFSPNILVVDSEVENQRKGKGKDVKTVNQQALFPNQRLADPHRAALDN